MKKTIVRGLAILGASLVLTGGGYVLGQQTEEKKAAPLTEKQMMWIAKMALAKAKSENFVITEDKDNAGAMNEMAALYQQAGNDPESGKAAIFHFANQFQRGSVIAKSAPQATQVAAETSVELQLIQVAQNQRIIELLEKLNNKK